MAGRTRDAVLDFLPVVFGNVASAQFGPVLPRIGTGADVAALVVAAQHWPGGHENRWQIHGQRAHDERRRRLVAAAHEHATVGRVGLEQLFSFHRQQIAVEHGRWLLERLRQ